MKIYLDDDSAQALLVNLLRREGYDVQTPKEAGLTGARDPLHLTHAIQDDRALISGNHNDFLELHRLLNAANGHHAGILIVRRDNDPTRDMTPRSIVLALGKLITAGVPPADGFHIVNHWR